MRHPEVPASVNDPRSPQSPWVMAYLTVEDPIAAVEFYENAFGFTLRDMLAGPAGAPLHAEMRWHDAVIMFGPHGAFGATAKTPKMTGQEPPVNLYFYVDDVDEAFERAVEAGARPVYEPRDTFWGDRCARVIDPDGYRWTLARHVGEFDPSKLPVG